MQHANADADLAACARLLRGGSRSFHAASLLLPPAMRHPATALYAFCRLADDAIDGGGDAHAQLRLLEERLRQIYAQRPADHPADRAFAGVVSAFGIPRALPLALLEGFQWDAGGRRYESLDELCDYAVRVAGSVGIMMTLLMRRRDPRVLARAGDLGVAMQLTNIARDVGEDARAGRLYLPLRWLREAGIDPDALLRDPVHTPALAGVVKRLLDVAQALYVRAAPGIAHLPFTCRLGMHAARHLYCEIGHEVARRDFDAISQRAIVRAGARRRVLLSAMLSAASLPAPLRSEALPEVQFLINAVHASRDYIGAAEVSPAWWRMHARLLRVIDLFERLERREQSRKMSMQRRAPQMSS